MGKGSNTRRSDGGQGKLAKLWEASRASFGLLSGAAMVLGIVLGLVLPWLDDRLTINIPVLAIAGQSSARTLLQTIATATVSVAGLSYSVTVVAFTLASQQLSPRVLRSFRSDWLSQVTLALFLGTFIFCLSLLVRLGISGEGQEPPNLSIIVAVLLALVSFMTFAGFVAHVIKMLQPSSVISAVGRDASAGISGRYPAGPGEPEDPGQVISRIERLIESGRSGLLKAVASGYLTVVDSGRIIECADSADTLVFQKVMVGQYVLEGQVIAEIWSRPGESPDEDFEGKLKRAFELHEQRTLVQDIAFPVRQLADIALKGLSPSINDPTTAENAMDAMTAFLIEFAGSDRPSPFRVGEDDEPRLVALAPGIDDLVGIGFTQVIHAAADHPVTRLRLAEQLELIADAARRNGLSGEECDRQLRSLRS